MGNYIFNITQLHFQVKNMKTEIKGNKECLVQGFVSRLSNTQNTTENQLNK